MPKYGNLLQASNVCICTATMVPGRQALIQYSTLGITKDIILWWIFYINQAEGVQIGNYEIVLHSGSH